MENTEEIKCRVCLHTQPRFIFGKHTTDCKVCQSREYNTKSKPRVEYWNWKFKEYFNNEKNI